MRLFLIVYSLREALYLACKFHLAVLRDVSALIRSLSYCVRKVGECWLRIFQLLICCCRANVLGGLILGCLCFCVALCVFWGKHVASRDGRTDGHKG